MRRGLWDALVDAGEGLGIEPAGMVALDRTRVEAGFPLIDVDFWNAEKTLVEGQKSTPYEINMGWAVNLKKPSLRGQARPRGGEARAASERFFVGLEVSFREIERLYELEGLAPRAHERDVPRRGADLFGRSPGRKSDDERLVAAVPEEVPRARHRRQGLREAGHVARPRVHRRVRAAASGHGKVAALPFFDPERKRSVP